MVDLKSPFRDISFEAGYTWELATDSDVSRDSNRDTLQPYKGSHPTPIFILPLHPDLIPPQHTRHHVLDLRH